MSEEYEKDSCSSFVVFSESSRLGDRRRRGAFAVRCSNFIFDGSRCCRSATASDNLLERKSERFAIPIDDTVVEELRTTAIDSASVATAEGSLSGEVC